MSKVTATLSLVTTLALAASAAGEAPSPIDACLDQLTIDKVNSDGGCINRIVLAGPEAIARLREKLDLTAVQPELRILPPADRLKREPTGELAVQLELTNTSAKVALVRTQAVNLSVRVSFQTFGFTWDAGRSTAVEPRSVRQQIHEIVPLLTDESCRIVFRIPVAMPQRGRYVFDYTLELDGPLTIPEDEQPGWQTSGRAPNQRPLGDGSIRMRTSGVPPVTTVGEPIPVTVTITNLLSTPLTLPDPSSYFASPYWFVIVDPNKTDDSIVARGNIILMEEMATEPSSQEVSIKRIAAKESIQIRGAMLTRLRPDTYSGFVGCTVFRDSGGRDLWIGESASPNFTFTILP